MIKKAEVEYYKTKLEANYIISTYPFFFISAGM